MTSSNFSSYNPKRISYILPTKDRAECIRKILPLILDMVTPEDELLIIDGGSTDNTAEVIHSFNNRVDIFISEPDIGQSHALNKGILLARGKYIKICNDDDMVYREGIEKMYEMLELHPEVDVLVGGGMWRPQNAHAKWRAFYVPPGTNYGSKPEDVFLYGGCSAGFLIRRSVFAKIGFFSSYFYIVDFEFLIRCIAKGINVKFCRVNSYSATVYEWSVTVRKKHEENIEKIMLARQYCSTLFFLGFYFKKSPLTRNIFMRIRRCSRMLFGARQNRKEVHEVWDGGFS
ncbi:MAG: glycosyltransferase [Candidatus Sungbacteria bacterium]|nr:glycosyltransferase [bacterium]MDZ4260369.1 glycosyltransferase [Candidatus Sungbacteria bacterium]